MILRRGMCEAWRARGWEGGVVAGGGAAGGQDLVENDVVALVEDDVAPLKTIVQTTGRGHQHLGAGKKVGEESP